MKMKPEHYTVLKHFIKSSSPVRKHGIVKLVEVYEKEHASGALKAKNIRERLRWDLVATIPVDTKKRMFDDLYTYLNDNHIDTALTKIVKELYEDESFESEFYESGDGADTPMETIKTTNI